MGSQKFTNVLAVAMCLAFTLGPTGSSSAQSTGASIASRNEVPFLQENDVAMSKMMSAMAIKPSGDVDRDFVDMMVPHHQGAIEMAIAVLRYGHNEQIRRLAQEIIIEQQQEITAMRLAVGETIPPSTPAPTVPANTPSAAQSMPAMKMDMK